MLNSYRLGPITLGDAHPLLVIAGPCVLEDSTTNEHIATTLRDICASLGMTFMFKASYDKANRTSISSDRGPGLREGLRELTRLRTLLGVPITTDIHESHHAAPAAEVVDVLQVPAFLCRQTELLVACAHTGLPVNVKKGQFLSPAEMRHVAGKLSSAGCTDIMLTERGTFFGYHRLVNDFIGMGDLMEVGYPVCFDVTHSTQLPGADAQSSGGRPERAGLLARAAVAAGVDAVFLECHPQPEQAPSDAATSLPLDSVESLLRALVDIRSVVTQQSLAGASAQR